MSRKEMTSVSKTTAKPLYIAGIFLKISKYLILELITLTKSNIYLVT